MIPLALRPLILIVDDNPTVTHLLRRVLEQEGLAVLAVGGGLAALEAIRREPDVALALLDVRMPGLDGPQTLTLLRRIRPELRAFFLTGDPSPYAPDELRARGADAVIAKPFAISELVREIRGVLALRS
jgi:CheY-like chemotaxis protein